MFGKKKLYFKINDKQYIYNSINSIKHSFHRTVNCRKVFTIALCQLPSSMLLVSQSTDYTFNDVILYLLL